MPQSDQGITNDRYTIIPRTAIFLRRGDSYLLLKGAPTKRLWANQYNGLGGHIEKGEDALSAAKREGIGLYIFSGECLRGEPIPSKEGTAEWVEFARLNEYPVVEDLPLLLAKIHAMKRGDIPFSARSYYDEEGRLIVKFAN